MSKDTMHTGHRARMRERIAKGSFECLSDHELLEYILFFTIPRANTNILAHRLLNHFGTFAKVLEASPGELMLVEGIGKKSADLLASYLPVFRAYELSFTHNTQKALMDSKKAMDYFKSITLGMTVECSYAMLLDQSRHLIKVKQFTKGTFNQASFFVDQVVKESVTHHARYIIIAHNHTAAMAFPSESDCIMAKQLFEALRVVQKNLMDFIIVDHFEDFSFAANGIIQPTHVVNPYEPPQKHAPNPPRQTVVRPIIQDSDDF